MFFMYYAYIIKSRKNHRFYIGSTQDIKKRIRQHQQGQTKILKNQGSFDIILLEQFATRAEAFQRERQIKSYKGGNAFKKLISKYTGTSLSLVFPPLLTLRRDPAKTQGVTAGKALRAPD